MIAKIKKLVELSTILYWRLKENVVILQKLDWKVKNKFSNNRKINERFCRRIALERYDP